MLTVITAPGRKHGALRPAVSSWIQQPLRVDWRCDYSDNESVRSITSSNAVMTRITVTRRLASPTRNQGKRLISTIWHAPRAPTRDSDGPRQAEGSRSTPAPGPGLGLPRGLKKVQVTRLGVGAGNPPREPPDRDSDGAARAARKPRCPPIRGRGPPNGRRRGGPGDSDAGGRLELTERRGGRRRRAAAAAVAALY
jgi:hypothetical protein